MPRWPRSQSQRRQQTEQPSEQSRIHHARAKHPSCRRFGASPERLFWLHGYGTLEGDTFTACSQRDSSAQGPSDAARTGGNIRRRQMHDNANPSQPIVDARGLMRGAFHRSMASGCNSDRGINPRLTFSAQLGQRINVSPLVSLLRTDTSMQGWSIGVSQIGQVDGMKSAIASAKNSCR